MVSTSSRLKNTLEKAMEAAREGEELLRVRQKHIQMADRSEHGWRVVKKYDTDDLANDSGDEKEQQKRRKQRRQKQARLRRRSYTQPDRIFPARGNLGLVTVPLVGRHMR